MILNLLILIAGFGLLVLGANWLVNGASSFASRLGLSELMIGLTIVAFGTSTPELVVNLVASGAGQNSVLLGNVIGSNLFNLLLILGLSGFLLPLTVQSKTVWFEIPFSILAVIALLFLANTSYLGSASELSRWEGGILLLLFLVFLYYIAMNMRKGSTTARTKDSPPLYRSVLLILVGLAGLVFGGKLVVQESSEIAAGLGMSEKLIGLTIISIGTSLPELATSLVAALKKNSDMAIGNIIGSNIFNIFFILGICAVIRPVGYDHSLNVDLYILGGATLVLFAAMFSGGKRKLDRWEAFLLVLSFIGYMIYIVTRN